MVAQLTPPDANTSLDTVAVLVAEQSTDAPPPLPVVPVATLQVCATLFHIGSDHMHWQHPSATQNAPKLEHSAPPDAKTKLGMVGSPTWEQSTVVPPVEGRAARQLWVTESHTGVAKLH